jgi:curli biogenesis system outer membrane secretion channel CsgG
MGSVKRILLVQGTVTGYNPGCKFCEYLFGKINDKGKSSISVRVKLVDKTTGEVIADAEMEGRSKDPGTGASRYTRVVDEIVRFIKSVDMGSS